MSQDCPNLGKLNELASIAAWMKNEIALTERQERDGQKIDPQYWPRKELAKEGLRLAMRVLPDGYVIGHAEEFSVYYFLEILANVLFRHGYEFRQDEAGRKTLAEVWGDEENGAA